MTLSYFFSQSGTPGTTITQLAFSPRENLIAWTDADGAFTRWPKPISDNFPDPVKLSIATNGAATIPVKPRTGLDLFGDLDDGPAPDVGGQQDDDVDLDDDMADIDEGWIVDDMDGALHKEPDVRRWDGNVKEMGKKFDHVSLAAHEANVFTVSITKAQPPFQPGSTPLENKKRYLGKHNHDFT